MKEKLSFIWGRIKSGRLQEMWKQTLWIYQYARRYWKDMIFYTLLGMVNVVISLLISMTSKDLVDIITGHETGAVIKTFCWLIGLNIGTSLMTQISDYACNHISMRVDAEIKSDIFAKIMVTDWESLTTYHTGDLLTRWSSDASIVSSGVLNFIPNMIIYIFRFGAAFVMMVYYDWTFAVLSFLGLPVSVLLSRVLMNRMVENNKKSAALGAKMSGFNQETFSNIQTLKAFDLIHLYIERLKNIQKEYINMKLGFQKLSMGTSLLLTTVGLVVSYASYGWGIHRVWSGVISYGTMTMFLGLSGTLTGTLQNLISLVPTAINLTTSAGRLMDIVEMPQEDYSKEDETLEFAKKHMAEGIRMEVKDISYAYQNGNQVFCGASLEANPHEIVALVGPSGEGKTTMLRLLLALINPKEGEIILSSGGEVLTMSPSARKLYSYVPQGNTMFSGTIAENMRNVKPEATDEEIIKALQMACAWEFVEKLPEGIHSKVKERGGGFSEGQAQRLSIARALLRNSPLLLLDEATSALDVATERKVLKNIMQDTYPRTCIVTTHRPTVLGACSRVYNIEEKKCRALSDEEIEGIGKNF